MTNNISKDISKFLSAQTCINVCCVDAEGKPYCFTCFYVFDESQQSIYFKSQMNTHHAQLLEQNGNIAGTILEDSLNPLMIKGIQLNGLVKRNSIFDINPAMKYHTKYPIAAAVPGEMWTIYLQSIKFTDNSKGFGHKELWNK